METIVMYSWQNLQDIFKYPVNDSDSFLMQVLDSTGNLSEMFEISGCQVNDICNF